ncbi:hypothetical protein C2E23DRAFT_825029 [Lenzites betulinus]|nr:hypothetical protein C2E23DRAFT_825029 [Lenzites betulinus]
MWCATSRALRALTRALLRRLVCCARRVRCRDRMSSFGAASTSTPKVKVKVTANVHGARSTATQLQGAGEGTLRGTEGSRRRARRRALRRIFAWCPVASRMQRKSEPTSTSPTACLPAHDPKTRQMTHCAAG